jgi:uncharacterized protein
MATDAIRLPSTTDAPLDAAERLHALDILRGFALLGMILVHFHQRMRLEAEGAEDLIGWFVYVAVEQKAWGTFAFLFGAGFAVLLRRLDARHRPVVALYLRRLVALAGFGILTEVLFGFHVLVEYAIWGGALLLIRKWSTRALLGVAVLSVAARPLVYAAVALYRWWTLGPDGAAAARAGGGAAAVAQQAVQIAQEQGSHLALVAARLDLAVARYDPTSLGMWFAGTNLTLFVLGLLAVRHGVFDDPRRHRRLIVGAMITGAVAWAMAWLVVPRFPPVPVPGLTWPLSSAFGLIQDQWLTLTYVGGLVLLLAYRPVWQQRLASFGFAGRMALTNYVLQAAVLDYLASGYGLALRIRPLLYPFAALLLFGVETTASRWWLARYRFGPLEWLWRSITYRQFQPLRRTPPEPLAPEPTPT